MLMIRNVFRCKPGKAKELVAMFKKTAAGAPQPMRNARVMTDLSGPFWTVVFEMETETLAAWEKQFQEMSTSGSQSDARKPMEGYMNLVDSGYREIWKIE